MRPREGCTASPAVPSARRPPPPSMSAHRPRRRLPSCPRPRSQPWPPPEPSRRSLHRRYRPSRHRLRHTSHCPRGASGRPPAGQGPGENRSPNAPGAAPARSGSPATRRSRLHPSSRQRIRAPAGSRRLRVPACPGGSRWWGVERSWWRSRSPPTCSVAPEALPRPRRNPHSPGTPGGPPWAGAGRAAGRTRAASRQPDGSPERGSAIWALDGAASGPSRDLIRTRSLWDGRPSPPDPFARLTGRPSPLRTVQRASGAASAAISNGFVSGSCVRTRSRGPRVRGALRRSPWGDRARAPVLARADGPPAPRPGRSSVLPGQFLAPPGRRWRPAAPTICRPSHGPRKRPRSPGSRTSERSNDRLGRRLRRRGHVYVETDYRPRPPSDRHGCAR